MSYRDISLTVSWLSATALLAAPIGYAEDGLLEEVVVFGSLVKRVDYTSPSPVFSIDQRAILEDGAQTLAAFLNKSPQFSPAFDRTSNNPGFGRGQVDLRGLGSNRTLVMLNGKRLGPAGSDGAVDINVIPAALIEKIEILTGGASSAYGSDAVSGVVNLSLKKDFEGIQIGGSYDVTDRGDGDSWDVNLVAGTQFSNGRGKISGFFTRTERDPINTSARSFSAAPLSEDMVTGELMPIGSPLAPSGWIPIPALVNGEFSPSGITFTDSGDAKAFDFNADGYNYYDEFNYLQTGLERDTAGAFFSFELTESLTAHMDVIWASIDTDSDIAPIPAFTFAAINLDNPFLTDQASQTLASNYDPDDTGLYLGPFATRLSQNGPRTTVYDRENYHLNLGLDGELGQGWVWEANYTYSEHNADIVRGNQVLADRFDQSFLVDPVTGQCFDTSNGCVGGNYFGANKLTPELIAFVRGPDLFDEEKSEQEIFQFIARGDIAVSASYSFSLAVGAEYREDSSRYTVDPEASSGNILASGSVTAGNSGSFDVSELYAEIVAPIPLGQRLPGELLFDGGLRYSDYSSVGSAPSWKAGVSWTFENGLMLRTMIQRAVRAPNIAELFSATVEEFDTGLLFGDANSDPCSASQDPAGNGVGDVCIAQGLPPDQLGVFEANPFYPKVVRKSGNEGLDAEEADTITVGVTWQPPAVAGLSLALDYYSIEIDNAIATLGATDLVKNCFDIASPTSDFCRAASRDQTGNIALVRVAPLNAAELTSKGFDLQLEYLQDLAPVNQHWDSSLKLGFIGNMSTEYGFRADPASDFLECAGYYGLPCNFTSTGSNPEYRANTSLTYQVAGFGATAVWRWIGNMENAGVYDEFLAGIPLVKDSGSQSYLDLNFSLDYSDRISLFAGVSNITDEDPPLLGFNSQQSNTNPNLYDVLGRRYHAGITVRL